MTTFKHLRDSTGRRNPSVNHLKWRQWINTFKSSMSSSTSYFDHSHIGAVASYFARYPSVQRRHELFTSMGNQALMHTRCASEPHAYLSEITRAFLEAGLHAPSIDERRFKKRQIAESHEVLQELLSAFSGMNASSPEDIYIRRLARRQGWAIDDVESTGSAIILEHGAPLDERARYSWAMSQTDRQETNKNTLQRLLCPIDLVGIGSDEIRRLMQLYDGYQTHLPGSPMLEVITACIEKFASSPCSAAHAIWWFAIINHPIDRHTIQWAQLCANRADSLTENERWMATTGIEHLMNMGKASTESEDGLRLTRILALLKRPKRSDIAWKSPLGHIHTLHS